MKQNEINQALILRDMVQKGKITLEEAQKKLGETILLTHTK